MADEMFPAEDFAELSYASTHHGNGRWNGVAIISRVGLVDARGGFNDDVADGIAECRIVSARCGPARVFCVYVPNGREVDSEHYVAKLEWLARLRRELDATCMTGDAVVVCGDFNVAPEDQDVWDITQFDGMTHVSAAERAALAEVVGWGLVDTVRKAHPDGPGPFSWWDYRAGAFHRGWGMRIDHVLASSEFAANLGDAWVDRDARKKGTGAGASPPSDHAPVVADFDL